MKYLVKTAIMYIIVAVALVAMMWGFLAMLASIVYADDQPRRHDAPETESVVEVAVMNYSEFFGADEDEVIEEQAPQTPAVLTGFEGITATADELELAARIIWLESRGESVECQRAVADVIFNRMRLGLWGTTLLEVLSAVEPDGSWAFTTWLSVYDDTTETTDEIRECVYKAFEYGPTIPRRVIGFARSCQSWARYEFTMDHTVFMSSRLVEVEG